MRLPQRKDSVRKPFERFAEVATRAAGHPAAASGALGLVMLWAISGPIFGFSEGWQLVVNTATTIATFLMVFIIQHSQNKYGDALQLKLNELIASHRRASNRLIAIEDLNEQDLRQLQEFYSRLAERAEEHGNLKETHSLDEADAAHDAKQTTFATELPRPRRGARPARH